MNPSTLKVYRCIITVIDQRCKTPAVSNMFYRSTWTVEKLKEYALDTYRKMLADHGYPDDLEITAEISLSSEEEVALYKRGMEMGQVSRNVN